MAPEWHEYVASESIRQARMQEAEAWRLAQLAHSNPDHQQATSSLIYAPALAWLGSKLVEWGKQLEARYGELKEAGSQVSLLSAPTEPTAQ